MGFRKREDAKAGGKEKRNHGADSRGSSRRREGLAKGKGDYEQEKEGGRAVRRAELSSWCWRQKAQAVPSVTKKNLTHNHQFSAALKNRKQFCMLGGGKKHTNACLAISERISSR